jgi:hypothetical protein
VSNPTVLFVLGLTPSRIGGIEIMTKEVCRQLADRGWQSVVVWDGVMSETVKDYFADVAQVEFQVLANQAGIFEPAHIPAFDASSITIRARARSVSFRALFRSGSASPTAC